MSQVCVAPDYVICNERVRDDIVRLAKDSYREFFGNNPQASHDLGRMVNERNFDRVRGMLDKTKAHPPGPFVMTFMIKIGIFITNPCKLMNNVIS